MAVSYNMPEEIRLRLKKYVSYKGHSLTSFAKTLGMQRKRLYILSVETGWFSALTISRIRRNYPDLNIEWLHTGEGSMLIDLNELEVEELINSYELRLAEKDERIRELTKLLEAFSS